MLKLGVNIDHVATLREARGIDSPDPVEAARICEQAGCDSIVCHLREDRRHIKDQDLRNLRNSVQTKLNLEMCCAENIVDIALDVGPDQATLVPEKRAELTTEGGLDVLANRSQIEQTVKRLSASGILVSLFIDPDDVQIRAAAETGAKFIELHTGSFCNAGSEQEVTLELEKLKQGVAQAKKLNLAVFAGHGLNYQNVEQIVRIEAIEELNIGHSIVAHSVFVGLESAVKQMLELMGRPSTKREKRVCKR